MQKNKLLSPINTICFLFFMSCSSGGEQVAQSDSAVMQRDSILLDTSAFVSNPESGETVVVMNKLNNLKVIDSGTIEGEQAYQSSLITGVALRNSGPSPVIFYFSIDGNNAYEQNRLDPGEAYDYRIRGNSVFIFIASNAPGGTVAYYKTQLDKGMHYHLVFDNSDNSWKIQSAN